MKGYEHTQDELMDRLKILHMVLGTWSKVALVLGVTEKTVYVWKNGKNEIPNYVWYVSRYFEGINSVAKSQKNL